MHNLQGIKEQQHKLCALSGQPEPTPRKYSNPLSLQADEIEGFQTQ